MPPSDLVRCVCLHADSSLPDINDRTWCGRTPHETVFPNASHALLHVREGDGRFLICRACAAAMRAALDKGTG